MYKAPFLDMGELSKEPADWTGKPVVYIPYILRTAASGKIGSETLKPRLWDNLENPESPTGVYLINHIQITAMERQSCSVCHEPKDIGHRGLRIFPWFHQKPAFSLICWRGKWTKLVCGMVSAKLKPAREDKANIYYCSREGESSCCFGETRPPEQRKGGDFILEVHSIGKQFGDKHIPEHAQYSSALLFSIRS